MNTVCLFLDDVMKFRHLMKRSFQDFVERARIKESSQCPIFFLFEEDPVDAFGRRFAVFKYLLLYELANEVFCFLSHLVGQSCRRTCREPRVRIHGEFDRIVGPRV